MKLRCNRITTADAGAGRISTECSFVSSDTEGAQLNVDQSGGLTTAIVADAADSTYKVHDVVEVTIAPAAPPV